MAHPLLMLIFLAPGYGFRGAPTRRHPSAHGASTRRHAPVHGARRRLPARGAAGEDSILGVCFEPACRKNGAASTMDALLALCPRGTPVSIVGCFGKCNYGPVVKVISAEGREDRWKDKPIFKKPGDLLFNVTAPEAAAAAAATFGARPPPALEPSSSARSSTLDACARRWDADAFMRAGDRDAAAALYAEAAAVGAEAAREWAGDATAAVEVEEEAPRYGARKLRPVRVRRADSLGWLRETEGAMRGDVLTAAKSWGST